MISILLLVVFVVTFCYGGYIVFKGEIKVGDGEKLIGLAARLMGVLYLLSVPIVFIVLLIFYLCLLLIGVSPDELENNYEFAYLVVVAVTLLAVQILVRKLSFRYYKKQNANNEASR